MNPAVDPAATQAGDDIAAIARGGRINILGFLIRLAARLPFLFLAGRLYGPEALGRFAYAILIVELAAQLATLGLRRGLAEQLANTDRPHAHVVYDAIAASLLAAAVGVAILGLFPQLMFPNSALNPADWLLPLIIFAIVATEIALAALAYRGDIGATVRSRAIVEPWVLSIAALALYFYSRRDGLIIAYVVSMLAAMLVALVPLVKSYGLPDGWRPRTLALGRLARQNIPLAAADAIEWGSRRLDLAILGLFAGPAVVGVYYVAQQVASIPQKLKTSFDPILGPVITRNLGAGRLTEIAQQIGQVGFWIIAAQLGLALMGGIPAEAVMGTVGPAFVGGAGALIFLLAAEAIAATAVVSEAVLVYTARHRNLVISLIMLAVQAGLSVALILFAATAIPAIGKPVWPPLYIAAMPALALCIALAFSSFVKARLLERILGAPVRTWRWPLATATAGAAVVGFIATRYLPEWAELLIGEPLMLVTYVAIIWYRAFTPADRLLFSRRAPASPPPGA